MASTYRPLLSTHSGNSQSFIPQFDFFKPSFTTFLQDAPRLTPRRCLFAYGAPCSSRPDRGGNHSSVHHGRSGLNCKHLRHVRSQFMCANPMRYGLLQQFAERRGLPPALQELGRQHLVRLLLLACLYMSVDRDDQDARARCFFGRFEGCHNRGPKGGEPTFG